MITETKNTLEIQESHQDLQVQSSESTLDVSEVVQSLTIQQSDNDLSIAESTQELVITEDGESSLEITPNAMVVNKTIVGAGITITTTAGEALGGHRAVVVQNGEAFYADKDTEVHAGQTVGITTHAATLGASVEIQYAGELEHSTWNFNPGSVYIGANGVLTQTRPTTGWVTNIGVALDATKLFINKMASIKRS